MTEPQGNDEENKTAVPTTPQEQSPIADDAAKPNPEPNGNGPKNQARLRPIRPLKERLPALIVIGVVLGLILAAAIVLVYRAGQKAGPAALPVASQSAAKGPLAILATGSMAKLITYETPQPAPALAFHNRDQSVVNLSDFEGQVVVLNVWATWCAPCVHEMPTLAALQSTYADKGVRVIALSVDKADKREDVKSFMDVQRPLEVYIDHEEKAMPVLKLVGMPTTLVLNKKGEIVARLDGDADWNAPEVHALLDALL